MAENEEASESSKAAEEAPQPGPETHTSKEEDDESVSSAHLIGVKTATSQTQGPSQRGSLAVGQSKTNALEETTSEINVEDAKKNITFSPSINEALADTIPPMKDIQIIHIQKDVEQGILNKAVTRLKEDFSETRSVAELTKMYDLYTSSLVDNSILESQCRELKDKLKEYEARHQWDPRVLKVLLIAEKYRHEKALVEDEKNDLEGEVIDMTIELKHMDDALKNKNKDIVKIQDELRKAKEIEKHVEHLETVMMKKDNEINALQDSYEALLQINVKLENYQQTGQLKSSIIPMSHEEAKAAIVERDLMIRIEHLQGEKTALKSEVDEKNKQLEESARKLLTMKTDNNQLYALKKENIKTLAKMQSENNRLLNFSLSLEKKMSMMRDQLTLAKAEVQTLKSSIEGCVQGTAAVSHKLNEKEKQNALNHRRISSLQEKVSRMATEQKTCTDSNFYLIQESRAKDVELAAGQIQLKNKKTENDALSTKLFKLEQFKIRQLELLKLTHMNSNQMLKEISGLRSSLFLEKTSVAKARNSMLRMQGQIEIIQKEYVNLLDSNVLLVRNHEMASAAIEHYEALKVNAERRIVGLMKTNIDLYTQTTSQQEIALIQNHQFQLKENEIKGLLSRLEEGDVKMERMMVKDKEKRCAIEQLHAEANSREEKIKTLKGIIESYSQLNKSLSDKVGELNSQLRTTMTQRELIRRQRDLFGTKLLQAKAETDLCQEGLRTATGTMTKYSVDFYNLQNDIRVLKLEVKNLRRKNKLSEGHTELIHTLRQDLGVACKELELQKCKNVILEETYLPRTHRWRGMLASDPTRYEMVLKNQLLIRRLISKTKEIARLEELLKQKDTMYMSLRVLVHRRMDSHLTPEMSSAKCVLRKQQRQLKSLTAELNLAQHDLKQVKVKEMEAKKKLDEKVVELAREKRIAIKRVIPTKSKLPALSTFPSLPRLTSKSAGGRSR